MRGIDKSKRDDSNLTCQVDFSRGAGRGGPLLGASPAAIEGHYSGDKDGQTNWPSVWARDCKGLLRGDGGAGRELEVTGDCLSV